MDLCTEPHCRYCSVSSYPPIVPCTVCEEKRNCIIFTTTHCEPEEKLIHSYYAPVCSDVCRDQLLNNEMEEFDRKMELMYENKGYTVEKDPIDGTFTLIRANHPMFVNVRESCTEPRTGLPKVWNSKKEGQPLSITSINMLIHDSPTLTEPSHLLFHMSNVTRLFFEHMNQLPVPLNWKLEYPGVVAPGYFFVSGDFKLEDGSVERVVLKLGERGRATALYTYDQIAMTYWQKVTRTEERENIIALLLPLVALGIHYLLPELVFFGLVLQKYLLKQKYNDFKLAAVCNKHILMLMSEHLSTIDAALDMALRMGTMLGSCDEFELLCDEFSEILEWAEQHNGKASDRYVHVMNFLGLAYKTTR
eukprot:TRINITY_DN7500_c0_g1_i1.p1 TRINITY_DN7500_c0_g1~~TRINITY_DN7500_c0_g1_i1.p1  ORF type:complete len:362 (+),score=58.65 TRINITY_DN7500_c0_g1_i1:313-1398(+)